MGDDATDEILAATYRALCAHGYADLTMQHIADEAGLSTAALHYHYDGKRGLLLAFLEYLSGEFTTRLDEVTGDTHLERLNALLETVLRPPDPDHHTAFATAILELKAQAPYDDDVRAHLRAFDDALVNRVHAIIRDGVAAGEFDVDDPDELARVVAATLDGARTRAVVLDRDPADARRELAHTLESILVDSTPRHDQDRGPP